jgi:hypothetical protein
MGKPSSTISARVAYESALKAGYVPVLLNPDVKMHSMTWDSIKGHPNVQHSKSGESIILAHLHEANKRPVVLLKTKGMLSESEVAHFESQGISLRL